MATTTRTGRTAMRTGRSSSPTAQGRFARTGGTRSQGRYARTGGTRTQGLRRRKPQQSGMQKILGSLLPAGAAKKATPNSKTGKAGGLALVAAAAGMAFKNRGKLSQLRHRDTSADTPTGVNASPTSPSSPSV